MTTSVWDDPDLRVGGEFVKFENVGDTVSGTVNAIRAHRFDDGSVAPQVLVTTDDGEERTITAGQVRLKAELATQRPEPGDHVVIKFTEVEKRSGGKTLKHFSVSAAAPAPAAVDPAAAAAALANLTPEQKAALGL
jgi:hypothetical protein